MTVFGVITRIPDPETGDAGNMAMPLLYLIADQHGSMVKSIENPMLMLNLRSAVFELGEIIILDDSGREIGGASRKPSKWDVDCQHFDCLQSAIERSQST